MILNLNKPAGWTSFDVCKKIKGITKERKVGHAGTLDPKASGLLIVCAGEKTKQMKLFENLDKTYIGIMKIGCVTDSFDSETEEKNHKEYKESPTGKIISERKIKDYHKENK